jgi:hypothetical protein
MDEYNRMGEKMWHSDLLPTEAGFISAYDNKDSDSDDEYSWGEYFVDVL